MTYLILAFHLSNRNSAFSLARALSAFPRHATRKGDIEKIRQDTCYLLNENWSPVKLFYTINIGHNASFGLQRSGNFRQHRTFLVRGVSCCNCFTLRQPGILWLLQPNNEYPPRRRLLHGRGEPTSLQRGLWVLLENFTIILKHFQLHVYWCKPKMHFLAFFFFTCSLQI